MKSLAAADRANRERFVCQQIHYSLQSREAENELIPIGISENIGTLVWSPLAGGLLTGKYKRGEAGPEGSRHFERKWKNPPIYDEEKLYNITYYITVANKIDFKSIVYRFILKKKKLRYNIFIFSLV